MRPVLNVYEERPAHQLRPRDVIDVGAARVFVVDEVLAKAAAEGETMVRAVGRIPGERRRRSWSWHAATVVEVLATPAVADVVWGAILDAANPEAGPSDTLADDEGRLLATVDGVTYKVELMLPDDDAEPERPPTAPELDREPF